MDYLRGTGSKPGSYTLKTSGGYPALAGMATWSINTDLDGSYAYANNFASIFTSCLTTSLEESVAEKSFSFFPNPASDQITINTENEIGETLLVIDAYGKKVHEQNITNTCTKIDLSNFESGMYLLQLSGLHSKLLVDK